MAKIVDCKADVVYVGPHARAARAFAVPGSGTKEKSKGFTAVVSVLINDDYCFFPNSVATICLQHKGQSAVYRAPAVRRGVLASNAAKCVQLVSVDQTDDYSGRLFAFPEVSTPGQIVRAAQEDGK